MGGASLRTQTYFRLSLIPPIIFGGTSESRKYGRLGRGALQKKNAFFSSCLRPHSAILPLSPLAFFYAPVTLWGKNGCQQTTELQSEQVQIIRASLGIEMVSSGILRFSLAKRSCLTSLQPIRIRAANVFAALAFLVWPARRRVLQRAVCHLAARMDNN